jgi:hypothetical protein
MPAQHPGVAEPADGVLRRLGHEVRVGQPVARVDQELPDLVGPEARQVEVEAKISQVAQFDAQQLLVPPRVEGEPVVGEDIRALLRLGEMRQLDHRHLGHAELARGQQPAVPGDDAALAIHQNGVGEAELTDRGGYLRHLHVAVGAGVARIRDQLLHPRRPVQRKFSCAHQLLHAHKQRRTARSRPAILRNAESGPQCACASPRYAPLRRRGSSVGGARSAFL